MLLLIVPHGLSFKSQILIGQIKVPQTCRSSDAGPGEKLSVFRSTFFGEFVHCARSFIITVIDSKKINIICWDASLIS